MFKSLFGGKESAVPPSKLPQLHALVEATVGGRAARSVMVDSVNGRGIVTKESLGRVGEPAVLVYAARAGRFRATSKIVAVTETSTQFETPKKVTLIGASTGAQKRQSVRLDTIVAGFWRYAPGGVGTGEFSKGTIRDISRGGCSLIIDRPLKSGTQVEVKMSLRSDAPALVLLGEVMRVSKVESSGKQSHGLRFHGVRPDEDQAIIEFINRRQADLRHRGLA